MNWKEAKQAMRDGHLVTHDLMRPKKQFLFIRPAVKMDPLFIITEVKTLPQAYKDTLIGVTHTVGQEITFSETLCLKTSNSQIHQGYNPTFFDHWTNTWEVYKP